MSDNIPVIVFGPFLNGNTEDQNGVRSSQTVLVRGRTIAVTHQLLEAFTLALSLPEDYFRVIFDKPMVTTRLLHYPYQTVVIDDDPLRCGAHTDYECFTFTPVRVPVTFASPMP